MNCGDRREPIFLDDTDHKRFVATLGEACDKTGTDWQVWNSVDTNTRTGGTSYFRDIPGISLLPKRRHLTET